MKLLSTLLVLVIAFGCSKNQETSIDDLKTAINDFNVAFSKGDTTALASMITENYVHTNSSWKSFGQEKWLSYMKARSIKLSQGILEVSEYKMDEYAVELFENTAVVTARITSKGVEEGVPFNKTFRVTNIWIYNGSRWRRAGFHDTEI